MKKKFSVAAESGLARTGTLKTAHGKLQTPFFMPVATKGAVKFVSMQELHDIGYRCFISNAFLFSIRPGLDIIKKAGGIHEFVNWPHAIFTDSGGFQILEGDFLLDIKEEGVYFRNPFDQKKELLTPEKAVFIQNKLGSDIAMCLDDVPHYGSSESRLRESQERTFRWAQRCQAAHQNKKQLLFGIAQGGTDAALREKSAQEIGSLDFDGFALGGLFIAGLQNKSAQEKGISHAKSQRVRIQHMQEEKKRAQQMIQISVQNFPPEKPRYLMGVGSPQDLVQSIAQGIDIFDSAFPTRTARHGLAFSSNGNLNLRNKKFKNDSAPLDKNCSCSVCTQFSRSYIHHLAKTNEENGMMYLSRHNLVFIAELMKKIRIAIKENEFSKLLKKWK